MENSYFILYILYYVITTFSTRRIIFENKINKEKYYIVTFSL